MKKVLSMLLVLCMMLTCMATVALAAEGGYTTWEFAEITGGKIRGYQYNGIYTYMGIPYAEAGRFEEPQDTSWEGTKDCAVAGAVSPQNVAYETEPFITTFTEWGATDMLETENCLNLNVWTPSMDPDAKKPVIVWIHGGGFSTGSGNWLPTYDGHNLAEYGDVVFVSVNARLNCLGYTDLSAFGEEYAHTGNLGMIDNVKALEWVNKNITTFGGDPENVTIVGQSGGGGKVMTIMGMPSAEGLFQRVWAMSGTQTTGRDPEKAKQEGVDLVEYLGLQDEEDPVAILKEMPYPELKAACAAVGVGEGPVQDGEIYQGTVIDGEFTELASQYPLILSTTFSEMGSELQKIMFVFRDINGVDQMASGEPMEQLTAAYGDAAEEIAEAFQEAYPNRDLTDVLSINANRSNALAIAKANAGGNIWQAVFTYKLPIFGGVNSWHTGGDVAFVFHNADKDTYLLAGDEENAYAFQDTCADALVAYAYTGDPSTESLAWPQFTVEGGETMILDVDSYVGNYHDAELLELVAANSQPDPMNPFAGFGGGDIPND